MSNQLSGMRAWLVQRISALYMGLWLGTFALWLAFAAPDYQAWRALFAHPLAGSATILFFLLLLLHAWVGIRDVILDYFQRFWRLRALLLAATALWLSLLAVWSVHLLSSVMASG